MSSALKILRRLIEGVIMVMFTVLICVVFYQVMARYIFNAPPNWTEELARYLQVWIALLASALCVPRGMHFAVDYLVVYLPVRVKTALSILVNVLVSAFLVLLLVMGKRILGVAGVQTSAALGLNMWYAYLAIPVGALLMLVENTVKLGEIFAGLRRAA